MNLLGEIHMICAREIFIQISKSNKHTNLACSDYKMRSFTIIPLTRNFSPSRDQLLLTGLVLSYRLLTLHISSREALRGCLFISELCVNGRLVTSK